MDIDAAGIRAARALLFTALCVTLSAGAHVLLSGSSLPLVPLFAVAVAVWFTAYALADRERSYARIAALLIPLELAADTVFTAGQNTCYGQAGGPVMGPLRSVGVDLVCGGGSFGTSLAGMGVQRGGAGAGALGTGSGSMGSVGATGPLPAPLSRLGADPSAVPWLLLAAHLCVGLIAAVWLRRGEAALARVLRAASVTAFRPLRLAVAACHRPYDTVRSVRAPGPLPFAQPPALPLLIHSVHRRGPPGPAFAA